MNPLLLEEPIALRWMRSALTEEARLTSATLPDPDHLAAAMAARPLEVRRAPVPAQVRWLAMALPLHATVLERAATAPTGPLFTAARHAGIPAAPPNRVLVAGHLQDLMGRQAELVALALGAADRAIAAADRPSVLVLEDWWAVARSSTQALLVRALGDCLRFSHLHVILVASTVDSAAADGEMGHLLTRCAPIVLGGDTPTPMPALWTATPPTLANGDVAWLTRETQSWGVARIAPPGAVSMEEAR